MRKDLIEQYFDVSTTMQRAWKHRVLTALNDEKISVAQMGVLFLIHEKQLTKSKDLATYMRITRSAVTQLVDGLAELGYITRREDTKDRRITHISLSKKGSNKLKALEKRRRAIFNELVAGLSDEQIKAAIEINSLMLKQIDA